MSDITPIHRTAVPTLDPQVRPSKVQTPTDAARRGKDQVELSDKAQYLSKIADLPDVRQGLIDRVRASIADGTYESEEKTDAAVDSLLEDIA